MVRSLGAGPENGQVLGVVVPLAVGAASPIGIAARIKGTLALMEKKVVCAIRTDHEVLRAVVGLVTIYVVDFGAKREWFSQCALHYEDVFVDAPRRLAGAGVVRLEDEHVPGRVAPGSAAPVVRSAPDVLVPGDETEWLPLDQSTGRVAIGSERGEPPTTAFAQAGQIIHGAEPIREWWVARRKYYYTPPLSMFVFGDRAA